jgi:uncharacterized protein
LGREQHHLQQLVVAQRIRPGVLKTLVALDWPTRRTIDRSLIGGAALFGVGWGLVGLCPGPALANLAGLSPKIFGFVVAMAIGAWGQDALRRVRGSQPQPA